MNRLLIGLLLGILLTAEGIAFAGAGHGSYAPLAFAASVFALIPLLALPAGPLLWAVYFLVIPNLDSSWHRVVVLSAAITLHLLPGFWLASQDPAFARIAPSAMLIFAISLLATIGLLVFFTFRRP